VNSLIGAQVAARFTPQLSAVLQIISEQNADSGFTPHIEWAFLKYQFTLTSVSASAAPPSTRFYSLTRAMLVLPIRG